MECCGNLPRASVEVRFKLKEWGWYWGKIILGKKRHLDTSMEFRAVRRGWLQPRLRDRMECDMTAELRGL